MHTLVKILSLGVKQLQEDPQRPYVAGLPRQTYEILVSGLTDQADPLQSVRNVKLMADRLARLPEDSVKLKGLLQTYKMLRVHTHNTNMLLRSVEGVVLPLEMEKAAVNFLPQQVAFASIATGLAEEHLGNDALLLNLGRGVLNHDIITDKTSGTLTENLGLTIQKAGGSAGVNFTPDTIKTLVKKATSGINKLTEKPGSLGVYATLFMATASLMTGFDAESQSGQQPEEVAKVDEESFSTNLSVILGFAAGFALREKKEKQEEVVPEEEPNKETVAASEQQTTTFISPVPTELPPTPVPQTVSAPSFSGLKSLFSSVSGGLTNLKNLQGLASNLKNLWSAAKIAASATATAGLSLALELGKKVFSKLAGLFSGGKFVSDESLKKAGFAIAIMLVAVILIPFLISNFITTMINPAPIATSGSRRGPVTTSKSTTGSTASTNCQAGMGGGESYTGETCPVDITPAISVYPTPVNSTGNVPRGLPISSSCITQPPGGSFTHQVLNAVDFGEIALFSSWDIRATHNGRVIWAGMFGGYGNAVLLEDVTGRFITYYGHILEGSVPAYVQVGNQIEEGAFLGTVDNNGFSTGNHLHYEVRGPRGAEKDVWGSKTGEFGEIGTINNFLPDCRTWSCQQYCYQ